MKLEIKDESVILKLEVQEKSAAEAAAAAARAEQALSNIYTGKATGTHITYDKNKVYHLPTAPGTGAITQDSTGAIFGISQKIYHQAEEIPPMPETWVRMGGSYDVGQLNTIYVEWISEDRQEYWIQKDNPVSAEDVATQKANEAAISAAQAIGAKDEVEIIGNQVSEDRIAVASDREAVELARADVEEKAEIAEQAAASISGLTSTINELDQAFSGGKNRFKTDYVMPGFYNSVGEHSYSVNRICTTKIPVKPDFNYAARPFSPQSLDYSRVVFFDVNGNVISTIQVNIDTGVVFKTPITCSHVAFTLQNLLNIALDPLRTDSLAHTFQLEEGTTWTGYEPYSYSLPATKVTGIPPDVSNKLIPLNRYFETGSEASGLDWLNKAIVNIIWFNVPDGEIRRLNAIGKNYSFSGEMRHYIGFRGNGATQISPVEWGSIYITNNPIPEGIKTYYLKYLTSDNLPENYLGRITINWDEIPNGVRHFEGDFIDTNSRFNGSTFLNISSNPPDPSPLKENYIVYDTEPGGYFDSLIEDDFANLGGVYPLGLGYVADWYSLWDDLMNSAPSGYITKRTLGTDIPTSGGQFLPMYAYEFNPPTPITAGTQLSYMPKVFIILAIHGYEKTGALSFYALMKRMVENWQESQFLEFLRFNIPFVVVPSANPHGWQDYSTGIGSRTNFHGVDLNRNFPIGWKSQGEGTVTYSGSSPASEVETQYLMALIDDYVGNGFIGLDIHNFGELPNGTGEWILSYQTTNNPLVYNVSKAFSLLVSRKLQEKYNSIPNSTGLQLSRAQRSETNGMARDYLAKLGYSATFEVCRTFPYDTENTERWDNTLIRIGSENIANFLRMMIKECAIDFNRR